jgi:hypothetical protein
MKSIGYALLLVALVMGGGILANVVSQMSEKECASQCPDNTTALSTKFEAGPFHLRLCNCGEVKK